MNRGILRFTDGGKTGLGKYGNPPPRLWLEQQKVYLSMFGFWTRKWMANEVLKIISDARFQVLDSEIMGLRANLTRMEAQRKGHSRWHVTKARQLENRESVTLDVVLLLLDHLDLELAMDEQGKQYVKKKEIV